MGIVKAVFSERGYGFLSSSAVPSVFVRLESLPRIPLVGDPVLFNYESSERGSRATRVQIIEGAKLLCRRNWWHPRCERCAKARAIKEKAIAAWRRMVPSAIDG